MSSEHGQAARATQSAASLSSATTLIALANFLENDRIRAWFQADPLVKKGRARIPDFAKAAFGPGTSVIAQYDLSPIRALRPARNAIARAADSPMDKLDWHQIEGREYSESTADFLPGDPRLAMRFAFAWDDKNLTFIADVEDAKVSNNFSEREIFEGDVAELFLSPDNSPLIWGNKAYYQFGYAIKNKSWEAFHAQPAPAKVVRTPKGYIIKALIPWTQLGVKPAAGLVVGISPAVRSAETDDNDPTVKLNWSFQQKRDGSFQLGTLQFE